ncbi:hypothetical protein RI129_005041 [Pyrocoelia pectoralis]|uniref:CHK kinase-like domain-containing protein n=1 Tax=Pyrocoelia pectoralis TaxID=417401 RepID=A0AAN7ZJY1_9COLE
MSKPTDIIVLTERQMTVFKEFLKHAGINEYSLTLSPGIEDSKNFCGVIIRADVKWTSNNNELTSNYIIKCAPPSDVLDNLLPVQNSYVIEIYVYSKIFQEFNAIQQEYHIMKPFKSHPIYYTSLPTTRQKMIVLQNVKELGYRHHSQNQPLDYEHILLVVKQYAQLHALSYAIRYHKPKLFDEFATNTQDHFLKHMKYEGILMVIQHRIDKALKALDPVDDNSIYEAFSYLAKNILSVCINKINSKKRHEVLSHIDCGIPNLLFKYDPISNLPTDVCIIDWQHSRLESPAVDLTTFIFSVTDKTSRQRYNELILEYHKSLCSFLQEFGCDGEQMLPFKVLNEELKKYGIVGLTMAILLIYIYSTLDQEIPDVLNDESHKEGYSFLYDLQDPSIFDKRVKDVVTDFSNLGYNFT